MRARNPLYYSRRSLLQTLAIGAGTLPVAGVSRWFEAKNAEAAEQAPIRRVVFVYTPNGVDQRDWAGSWFKMGAGESDFVLGGMLTPFEALRDQLVLFDGLSFASDKEDPNHDNDTHQGGTGQVLTAARLPPDGQPVVPKGHSIDQYLAQKVGRAVTPVWPSIEIGVQTFGSGCCGTTSYLADGSKVPMVDDPVALYQALFGNLTDQGKPMSDPALARRMAMRKSVLDNVAKDLAMFRSKLPKEDQARADAQLASIRTMEDRLASTMVKPPEMCSKPAGPDSAPYKVGKNLPAVMKAQANIMVSAFGCDLSRVVNWHVRGAFCEGSCDFGGSTNPEMLHVLSHDYLGDFVKVKRAMFEQVAYFAQQLKQTPDRGGTTMLDNTLIVLTSEIAAGHTHSRMPFVTIGGKNMGVKTGRAMKLPVLFKGNTNVARDGTPHSMLFVSILNMMGVPDTWFGIKEYCQGPLPGFTTT